MTTPGSPSGVNSSHAVNWWSSHAKPTSARVSSLAYRRADNSVSARTIKPMGVSGTGRSSGVARASCFTLQNLRIALSCRQVAEQRHRPVHRGVSAAPGAVRDVASEEYREQERLGRVDCWLQLGRRSLYRLSSASIICVNSWCGVNARASGSTLRISAGPMISHSRVPRRDLLSLGDVARADPLPGARVAVAESEELDTGSHAASACVAGDFGPLRARPVHSTINSCARSRGTGSIPRSLHVSR